MRTLQTLVLIHTTYAVAAKTVSTAAGVGVHRIRAIRVDRAIVRLRCALVDSLGSKDQVIDGKDIRVGRLCPRRITGVTVREALTIV